MIKSPFYRELCYEIDRCRTALMRFQYELKKAKTDAERAVIQVKIDSANHVMEEYIIAKKALDDHYSKE